MTTIGEWVKSQTSDHGSLATEVKLLIGHLLAKNTAWIFAHQDYILSKSQINQLNLWYQTLLAGKPLAYITGTKEFWDLKLYVNEHTLIPRPETELLVETACQIAGKSNIILDLGTGSGAIALALARQFPTAKIIASDQSKEALKVAKHNAQFNSINTVQFLHSNWLEDIHNIKFDLIISNPPYLDANDEHLPSLKFEPVSALVAGDHGLADFITISRQARNHLNTGGIIMFEHGWKQKDAVTDILVTNGFAGVCSKKDLAGLDRITWGFQP